MTCVFREIVAAGLTLGQVIERLEARTDLSDSRRRDLVSAVQTTARLLHRNPTEIDANVDALRGRLAAIHPVQAGISEKRLANVKSGLLAAIQITQTVYRVRIRKRPISPAWKAFLITIEVPWQRWSLSRLARFCSGRGIAPAAMSDEALEDFRKHLKSGQLAKDPDKVIKIVRQTWNGIAARSMTELPALSKPSPRRFTTRPLSTYPASFQDDLQAWLRRQSRAAMFDEDAPRKPLRPTSLRNIQANIRQFTHALVEEGYAPEKLRSLADIVEFDAYRKGLQHLLNRNGGKRPAGLANMAGHLLAIAKYHVKADAPHLERLRQLKGRLVIDHDGLTEKNRRRLHQFENERNVERLIDLPYRLLKSARTAKHPSRRHALAVMYAVAIEILLSCPMRVGNLAILDIERHLRWYGSGHDEKLAIAIPGSEVKNGQSIEIDLPRESLGLVAAYLANWRQQLFDQPTNALFPMHDGRPRLPVHFSTDMCRVIYRETGIEMNGHLFRHLAGMLYLKAHPGEYETVRRLLGHRKLDTTTSFYAPLENRAAVQRYDEAVLSTRRAQR